MALGPNVATTPLTSDLALTSQAANGDRYTPAGKKVSADGVRALSQIKFDPTALTLWTGTAPTITLTASSVSTIVNAVRIYPKMTSATQVDTSGTDPNFLLPGIANGHLPLSSGDCMYADFLIGGSLNSQAAHWTYTRRFYYTGQAFEWYFRTRSASSNPFYRIKVDGKPVTADFQSPTVTSPTRYVLKFDFGSVDTRLIEIETSEICEDAGFFIEPTGTMTAPSPRPVIAVMGDSLSAGANTGGGGTWRGDKFVRVAASLLGCDFANLAIGGSGYFAPAGFAVQFNQRLQDVIDANPDVLIIWGGQNDALTWSSQVYSAAVSFINSVKAALPATRIVVIGMWMTQAVNPMAITSITTEAGLKQAAADTGSLFISIFDPQNLAATATPWATTTAYVLGQYVLAGGLVWRCIVGHTSTGSWDATKWKAMSFITGTGKTTGLVGDGNADVFISSDGIHPTPAFDKAFGRFVAEKIIAWL